MDCSTPHERGGGHGAQRQALAEREALGEYGSARNMPDMCASTAAQAEGLEDAETGGVAAIRRRFYVALEGRQQLLAVSARVLQAGVRRMLAGRMLRAHERRQKRQREVREASERLRLREQQVAEERKRRAERVRPVQAAREAEAALAARAAKLAEHEAAVAEELAARVAALALREAALAESEAAVAALEAALAGREATVAEIQAAEALAAREAVLAGREAALAGREAALERREAALAEVQAALAAHEAARESAAVEEEPAWLREASSKLGEGEAAQGAADRPGAQTLARALTAARREALCGKRGAHGQARAAAWCGGNGYRQGPPVGGPATTTQADGWPAAEDVAGGEGGARGGGV